MDKRQINYYRERVDYKNICTQGEIVEAVIFNTPELSYKFHIFILHNGIQTEKLYRKSLSEAKKTAYKQMKIARPKKQTCFCFTAGKTVSAVVNGKTVQVPEYMEIQVRG